jgi:hypothetical protein
MFHSSTDAEDSGLDLEVVVLTSGVLNANLHYCTNHLEPSLLITSWKRAEEAVEEYYLVDNLRLERVSLSGYQVSVM